jgi:histone-lysine N-methyltransferase SETMAR
MLTPEKKQKRVEICEESLKRYREEGGQFLLNIVTGDDLWIHHFDPEEKRLSMEYRHTSSPRPKKFKTIPSAVKILLTFLELTKSLHDRIFRSWEDCQFSSVH